MGQCEGGGDPIRITIAACPVQMEAKYPVLQHSLLTSAGNSQDGGPDLYEKSKWFNSRCEIAGEREGDIYRDRVQRLPGLWIVSQQSPCLYVRLEHRGDVGIC